MGTWSPEHQKIDILFVFAFTMDLTSANTQQENVSGTMETLIAMAVAAAIFLTELQRRNAQAAEGRNLNANRRTTAPSFSCKCRMVASRVGPEVGGLLCCLGVALALRARGDTTEPDDAEGWERIKSQWPMLITADSLLSVQAMLRLVALTSAALRIGTYAMPVSALCGEPALMLLLGGLCRAWLVFRTNGYMLDGPLGGKLPVVCELGALPLCLFLCRGSIRRNLLPAAVILAGVALLASRNYLQITDDDRLSDSLFIAAHALEFIGALTFLGRTVLQASGILAGRASLCGGLLHCLLPLQQSLAAYFFFEAWEDEASLIGAGKPFALLKYGNVAQLGFYLGAAALYLVDAPEDHWD